METTDRFDRSAWSAIEIGLAVEDIAPMRRFYAEGLGFEPAGIVDLPGKAYIEGFRFGDCLLKLAYYQNPEQRPKADGQGPSTVYLTLRVADLEKAVESCLAIGARLLVPMSKFETKAARSGLFAFVLDPMGNRVELVQGNAWSDADAA